MVAKTPWRKKALKKGKWPLQVNLSQDDVRAIQLIQERFGHDHMSQAIRFAIHRLARLK